MITTNIWKKYNAPSSLRGYLKPLSRNQEQTYVAIYILIKQTHANRWCLSDNTCRLAGAISSVLSHILSIFVICFIVGLSFRWTLMQLRPISRQLFICLQSVSDGAASNLFLHFCTACKIRPVRSTLCKAKMYNKPKQIAPSRMFKHNFLQVQRSSGTRIHYQEGWPCALLWSLWLLHPNCICLP